MRRDSLSTPNRAYGHFFSDSPSNRAVVQGGTGMDPNQLLKENVKALLRIREKEPEDLAKFFRKTVSWIDKIFRYEHRTFPIRHYDTLAKFFGVEVYQLLQPGIAERSERRSGTDRRKIPDRRVSRAVVSEKALDVDIVHIVRALSLDGRRKALDFLMDILNDELQRLRSTPGGSGGSGHSGGTPPATRVRRKKTPKTNAAE